MRNSDRLNGLRADEAEKIDKIYTDPGSIGGFSGVQNLLSTVKKKYPKIKKESVRKFLETNRTYTLFKPRRVHHERSKFVPAGFLTDLQADLGDFQSLADKNRGYRFMLVAVDTLSRRVFAAPVEGKSGQNMRGGFEKIFSDMPYLPQQIFTDRGMEFESKEMKNFFKGLGIAKFRARASEMKAAVAERMIKTIKQRLYRYFSEKNTTDWVTVLPKITSAINHSICRITGKRPIDVNEKNASEIWDQVYGSSVRDPGTEKTKYSKHDAVRISRVKQLFEKGYLPTFSDQIYEVMKASRSRPNYYELADFEGEPIEGRFYTEEMVKTKRDENTTYRIEKILKKTKKSGKLMYFVKFIGYPDPEWIKASDIV